MSRIGRDLTNVPMGRLIRDMAFAIADAQFELDKASIKVAQMMGGRMPILDENGAVTETIDTRVYFGFDDNNQAEQLSMLELGFSPTFYQFTNNLIEVKIAIKLSQTEDDTTQTTSTRDSYKRNGGLWGWISGSKTKVGTTTVDATYATKYNYSAEGSSLLRCNLTPIPAPAMFEERVRALIGDDDE